MLFKVEDEVEKDADYVAGGTKPLMMMVMIILMIMMIMMVMMVMIGYNSDDTTGKTGMPASVVIGLFLLVSCNKKIHYFCIIGRLPKTLRNVLHY